MKNKINERSGLWLDLRVDNPENPSCFWNSVGTSSFLDKRGKSQGPFFRKSPLRKIRFPYRVCLWGVRVLPLKSRVSASVCREVGDTEAGGARCGRPASAGTLWNEPSADELPNAPRLRGGAQLASLGKCSPSTALFFPPLLPSPSAAQNGFPAPVRSTRVKADIGLRCRHSHTQVTKPGPEHGPVPHLPQLSSYPRCHPEGLNGFS